LVASAGIGVAHVAGRMQTVEELLDAKALSRKTTAELRARYLVRNTC
jgi:hypothetical protein